MPEKPGILKYFAYGHLPEHLQAVSKPFYELAMESCRNFPDMASEQKAETVAGLRKLLEAKDCIVRAQI